LDSIQNMGEAAGFGSRSPERNQAAVILLAEDNEDDVFLMERALREAGIKNPLSIVEDGQEAIDYLSGSGPYADRQRYPLPAILFLDLKMPRKSGFDVLKWVRSNEALQTMVIVVLTSSEEPSDISRAYREGANSYLVKPPTGEELLTMAKQFKWYWLDLNRFEGSLPMQRKG